MPEIQIIAKESHDTLSTIKGTSARGGPTCLNN